MITQSMIIELRKETGAGVINCRNVLNETQGDMEKAIALLKEKGLTIAATKAERKTTEGLISAYVAANHQRGAILEFNCETDFVAVNQDFGALANHLAMQAATSSAPSVPEFLEEKYAANENITVKEAITSLISKLRENVTIGRFSALITQTGFIQSYLHNGGRIGVLVELNQASSCDSYQALSAISKEIALQIAAANPLFIDKNHVDPEILENEKQSYQSNALKAGKPEALAAKIALGKIGKFLKEKCLMEQAWIKNEELTIADYLREESRKYGAEIRIQRFVRYERGQSSAEN